MSLDEHVSALIKRVYSAGEDTSAWDHAALDVLKICGGRAGVTTLVDLSNRAHSSYRFYGPETSRVTVGLAEYAERCINDSLFAWASPKESDWLRHGSATKPQEERLARDFVRWNCAPSGWHVGYTEPEDDLSFSFSVHFPVEEGQDDPERVRLFRMLFEHMACAVRLRRRPFSRESNRALLLLDSAGMVRHLSAGADRTLGSCPALCVENRRLVTACPHEQSRLDRAVAMALNTVSVGTTPQAVELHPARGRRWIVVIRPMLSTVGPFDHVRCELLVEIHDGLPRIGPIDLLQSLFDLTGREMQVVRLLADGHSVESLAACMEISPNTARTHLRAIFSKTETGRQSELMHLCAGLSDAL